MKAKGLEKLSSIAIFGSAGKIETCRAHPDFYQQNRRGGSLKQRSGLLISVFRCTSGIARRK